MASGVEQIEPAASPWTQVELRQKGVVLQGRLTVVRWELVVAVEVVAVVVGEEEKVPC